jgi:hypothetical protein
VRLGAGLGHGRVEAAEPFIPLGHGGTKQRCRKPLDALQDVGAYSRDLGQFKIESFPR